MADVSSTTSTPSGLTGAGGGDMLRIVGMATGLDIDGMVTKMLLPDKTRIDKAQQGLQVIQWKKDMYSDIFNSIKDLQNTFFNVTAPDTNLLSTSNYTAFDVKSSLDTIATASATTGAMEGNYNLNVQQLAKAAIIQGSSISSQVKVTNSSDWSGKTITFSVGTKTNLTITLDSSLDTPDKVINSINSQISNSPDLNGKISASLVTQGTDTFIKFNKSIGDDIKLTDNGGITDIANSGITNKNIISLSTSTKLTDLVSGTNINLVLNLKYNGTEKSITLDNSGGTKTIDDLIKAISDQTSGKVVAKLDDITGKFSLSTSDTGSVSNIQIEDSITGVTGTTSNSLLNSLGLSSTLNGNIYGSPAQGQDAKVTITSPGGNVATVTQSKNTFTSNGVTYNLVDEGSTDITVQSNVDTVMKKITDFIDKYNALVDKVNTKLTEKKNYDYKPLTDDQKKSMTQDQITAWEAKAKEGLLKGDSNLENMMQSIRNAFFEKVEGAGISFGKNGIGLDTTADWTKGGKIEFVDSVKDSSGNIMSGKDYFKQMLKDHTQDVVSLFAKSSTETDKTKKYNNDGIFQRIDGILRDYVGNPGTSVNSSILSTMINTQNDYSISGTGGKNTFPDQIYRQNILIKELNTKYKDNQEKYYKQFSALETAMNSLNTQQAWLSQQFGIGG